MLRVDFYPIRSESWGYFLVFILLVWLLLLSINWLSQMGHFLLKEQPKLELSCSQCGHPFAYFL